MSEPLEYRKHERFAQEYCWDLNGADAILRTRCYKRQEYDGDRWYDVAELDPEDRRDRNYAAKIARRILRYADVQERIDEILEEKELQTKIRHQQLEMQLLKIAEHELDRAPTYSEKLSAIEKLAKHSMFYEDSDKGKMKTFAEAMKELLGDGSNKQDGNT